MLDRTETDSPREYCAVIGISLKAGAAHDAAARAYDGLLALQHRGQEGAGIAVARGGVIHCEKNPGLVTDALTQDAMDRLDGASYAVGHTRYSTAGGQTAANIQPFVAEYLTGRVATVHNGNIVNAAKLRHMLQSRGLTFTATSDSEVISVLAASHSLYSGSVTHGAVQAARELHGAFSLCLLTGDGMLLAMRDPNGFRPLCLGQSPDGLCVASESCALAATGFSFVRDIKPGELIVCENGELTSSEIFDQDDRAGLCVFEYVYFARPDSDIDGLSVFAARHAMGRTLAQEYPVDADVVCPVPDSGTEAALGYAAESGIPYASAFVKNRYIGRSFIYPTQAQREAAVRLKLNPLRANVENRRVVLVDDSIVRGTTSAKIIRALREAGATEVHVRVSSPPFRYPCYFGTDVDDRRSLIANSLDTEGICRAIGADSLGYISVGGLLSACSVPGRSARYCDGCFTGRYGIEIE